MAAESYVGIDKIISQTLGEDNEHENINLLSKLADQYAEKAEKSHQWLDFFKAHGLYNACGKREAHESIWYQKAYDIECKYHQLSCGNSSHIDSKKHFGTISVLKRSLVDIRGDISSCLSEAETLVSDLYYPVEVSEQRDNEKERNFCKKMKIISRICSGDMLSFVSEVLTSALKLFGHLPCQFAVIGIGSLAKCEVTPFSDLEYIFLIEKEEYQAEFERLAVTSYFVINNLQESNLKVYDIKELDRFPETTKCGFQIDGLSANAGNIPTGHGPGTKTHNQFIKTVDQMFQMYEGNLLFPTAGDKADLSALMESIMFVFGNKSLFEKLKHRMKKCQPNEARRFATIDLLQRDVDKFDFLPDENMSKIKDVKEDFFRFPSIILFDMKIACQIQATAVWDVIDELKHSQNISTSVAASLEFLMSTAQYVRLKTYIWYESRNNKISVLPGIRPQENLVYFPQSLFLIMCLHLIPLKNMVDVKEFSLENFRKEVPREKDIAAAYTFYYMNDFLNCIKHFKVKYEEVSKIDSPEELWMYLEALNSAGEFNKAFSLMQHPETMRRLPDEKKLFLKCEILCSMGMYREALEASKEGLSQCNSWKIAVTVGDIYSKLGDMKRSRDCYTTAFLLAGSEKKIRIEILYRIILCYNEKPNLAKQIYQHYLEIMKKKYGDSTCHPEIAVAYAHIGSACSDLFEYDQALNCFRESLEIWEKVYGDNHPKIATLYDHIGTIHLNRGDYNGAFTILYKSLKIRKKMHVNADHPDIAGSYHNIGNYYSAIGDYPKALAHYNKFLEIMKKVYGGENHRDIATSYKNIGMTYYRMGKNNEAITSSKRSLEINEQVYGDANNPSIAHTYKTIGKAYAALGDDNKALINLNRSLEIFKQVYRDANHPAIVSAQQDIGNIYSYLGNNNQALINHN